MKIKCSIARGMFTFDRIVRVALQGDRFIEAVVSEDSVEPKTLPAYGEIVDGWVEVMEISADKNSFLLEFYGVGLATGPRFRYPKEIG